MKVKLITIIVRNYIENICSLTQDYTMSYKTLSIQDKIKKLSHILFLISLVKEEDICLLNKKEIKRYKDTIKWVLDNINTVAYTIVANNFKVIDNKINEEEDLSKLSKEELIARLREATK